MYQLNSMAKECLTFINSLDRVEKYLKANFYI